MPDYAPLREFQALAKEVELQSRELGSLEKQIGALERWKDVIENHLNHNFTKAKGSDDAIEKHVTRLERTFDKAIEKHAAEYNVALQKGKGYDDQLDVKILDLRKSLGGDVSKLWFSVSKLQNDVSKLG